MSTTEVGLSRLSQKRRCKGTEELSRGFLHKVVHSVQKHVHRHKQGRIQDLEQGVLKLTLWFHAHFLTRLAQLSERELWRKRSIPRFAHTLLNMAGYFDRLRILHALITAVYL